jgi:hypothetical protein
VAIALALCLKKGKELPMDQKVVPTQTTIHTKNLMTDLMMCGPKDFFAGDSTVRHLMG